MKTNFVFWVASVSLAPTLGFALAEAVHSARAEGATTQQVSCEQEARTWAYDDFAFYADGTRSDGSPAIDCAEIEVTDDHSEADGSETLQFRMQCYTLDRAIQRKYEVSARHLSSGECQKQSLNSEDNSP